MAKYKADFQFPTDKTAAESARIVLPRIAREFFRYGRDVVSGSADNEDLHGLRLRAKHLRYSLELFQPCYGSGLDQRIEALKNLQDHLGAISDCDTVTALIDPTLHTVEGSTEFLQFIESRANGEREAFLRRWRETFDAPGQEKWWVDYLSRPAAGINDRGPELVESSSDERPPRTPLKLAIG